MWTSKVDSAFTSVRFGTEPYTEQVNPQLVSEKILQVALAEIRDISMDEELVHQKSEYIEARGGILLTRMHMQVVPEEYVGVAAMPERDGGYCLHLCPGRGGLTFKRLDIDRLMPEACTTLAIKDLIISRIAPEVGRQGCKEVLENFKHWQEEQIQRLVV